MRGFGPENCVARMTTDPKRLERTGATFALRSFTIFAHIKSAEMSDGHLNQSHCD